MQNKKNSFCTKLIPLAFCISILYWIYLWFSSNMIIRYDSVGYENLASMINKNGWVEYFRTGPNREPIYPWILAGSMRLADFLGISYQPIQKFIQVIFLFVTQILVFRILKKIGAKEKIIALTILYLGFSPALVNSAFSLYSEIVTYPLLLGIILLSIKSWETITRYDGLPNVVPAALGLGILFILITSVKAIFELIIPLFLLSYVYLAIDSAIKGKRKVFVNSVFFISIVVLLFQGWLYTYKSINLKYNGHFVTTDRGPWAIYGNAARRTQDLKFKDYLAALAYVAGENVCLNIFGKDAWVFWSFRSSDAFGYTKRGQLSNEGIPENQIASKLIHLTIQKILEKPWAYGLLMTIEGLKIFFWESTKIGYVEYPSWLQRLFDLTLFKNGLRLSIFLISFASFWYLLWRTLKAPKNIFSFSEDCENPFCLSFFILTLLTSYIGIHSFFFILPRYALPVAPLFLVLIAFSCELIFKKFK